MWKQDLQRMENDETEDREELKLLYEMGNRISFIEEQLEKMNGVLEEAMEAIKRKDLEIELLKQMQSKGCTFLNQEMQSTKARLVGRKNNIKNVPPINPLEIWMPKENHESDAELNFTGIKREFRKPSKFVPNEAAPSITSFDSVHSLQEEELAPAKDLESQIREKQILTKFDESSDDLINRYLNCSNDVESGRVSTKKRFKKISQGESTKENSKKSVQEFIYFLNERNIFTAKPNDQPEIMVKELNRRCKSLVSHALGYSAERKSEKKSGNGKLIVQIKISNTD